MVSPGGGPFRLDVPGGFEKVLDGGPAWFEGPVDPLESPPR